MFVSLYPVEARQAEGLHCAVEKCTSRPVAQIAYNMHGRSGSEPVCAGHVLDANRQACSTLLFGRFDG